MVGKSSDCPATVRLMDSAVTQAIGGRRGIDKTLAGVENAGHSFNGKSPADIVFLSFPWVE